MVGFNYFVALNFEYLPKDENRKVSLKNFKHIWTVQLQVISLSYIMKNGLSDTCNRT
jgi:hypothetical protein